MSSKKSKILNSNLGSKNCINCTNLKTKVFKKEDGSDFCKTTKDLLEHISIDFKSSNNVRCVKNNIIDFDSFSNDGIRKGTDNKPLSSVLKSLRHYETIAINCKDYDSEV